MPPPLFTLGPDQKPEDLRLTRPYFIVPLDDPRGFTPLIKRICDWAAATADDTKAARHDASTSRTAAQLLVLEEALALQVKRRLAT